MSDCTYKLKGKIFQEMPVGFKRFSKLVNERMDVQYRLKSLQHLDAGKTASKTRAIDAARTQDAREKTLPSPRQRCVP